MQCRTSGGGKSTSFTITAAIASDVFGPPSPDGPATFDNVVSVESDHADPDEGNNEFTLSTLVDELADLSVSKVCKPDGDAVFGEDQGFCEIFVRNDGPSMARNVTLDDQINGNGAFTVSDDSALCSVIPDANGDNVLCDLGDIDAGDRVVVTVFIDATSAGDVNDNSTVDSDTPDPSKSNNMDRGAITFAAPTADLIVTKQCKPDEPALAGSEAFCEIFVYNNVRPMRPTWC